MLIIGVGVVEDFLLGNAVCFGDGVPGDAGNRGLGIRNDNSVLNIESLDFGEWIADELSDDCEHFVRINGHTGTVKSLIPHTIGVKVTPVRIGRAAVSRG